MIMVSIVAIASIMGIVIVGMMSQAITQDFIDSIITNTTESKDEILDVYDSVELYGSNVALWSMVGGVIGIIAWWFMSSQQRETVTGVYA